jgi:hypothetical protein
VNATAAGSTLRHWRPAVGSACHFAEQRPDRRKHAQEAARAQQLPPLAPAGTQKLVEPLLVDLVHVQEAVGLALAKNVVFDVLANDAGAVLVTAAEQVAAVVMVLSVCMNLAIVVVVLMGVRHLSPFGCAGMTLGIDSNPIVSRLLLGDIRLATGTIHLFATEPWCGKAADPH